MKLPKTSLLIKILNQAVWAEKAFNMVSLLTLVQTGRKKRDFHYALFLYALLKF
jgi:hypothetical protein